MFPLAFDSCNKYLSLMLRGQYYSLCFRKYVCKNLSSTLKNDNKNLTKELTEYNPTLIMSSNATFDIHTLFIFCLFVCILFVYFFILHQTLFKVSWHVYLKTLLMPSYTCACKRVRYCNQLGVHIIYIPYFLD